MIGILGLALWLPAMSFVEDTYPMGCLLEAVFVAQMGSAEAGENTKEHCGRSIASTFARFLAKYGGVEYLA